MTKKQNRRRKKFFSLPFFFFLLFYFFLLHETVLGLLNLWSTVYMTPRFPYIFLEIVLREAKRKKFTQIPNWLLTILLSLYSSLPLWFPLPTEQRFPVSYSFINLPNVLIDLVLTHAHITHTHIHTQYSPLVITRGPRYFHTVFFILWHGNKFQPCPYRVIHPMSKKPVVAGSTSLKVCIYIYAPHDDKNSLGQRLICCFSSQRLLQTCKIPTAYL